MRMDRGPWSPKVKYRIVDEQMPILKDVELLTRFDSSDFTCDSCFLLAIADL
jgi:hypothetical protein